VQAHTALARNIYADHPRLNALAVKYAKSPTQMLIRYSLQKGWTPVVGARDPAHLATNAEAEAEGFEIEEEHMVEMDGWDRGSEGAVRKLSGWERVEGCADFVSPVVEERVRD
jgi:diketogulonate reductase-like aldo/keto reductase